MAEAKLRAQDRLRETLRDHVAPRLRQLGFKGSGTTFRRRVEDTWQVVNFQSSQWSDRTRVSLTINLGVGIDRLPNPSGVPWKPAGPLEYQCQFHARAGALARGGRDYWWTVKPGTSPKRLAAKLIQPVEEHGLRWLDFYSDPSAVLEALADGAVQPDWRNLPMLKIAAELEGSTRHRSAVAAAYERWDR